ncbi:MAG TPA: serpin family protein [Acidobacteriaceae bacterium]|jgi:serpin B|nr:serpin family protein [Acidobacteriaceae bacterium]
MKVLVAVVLTVLSVEVGMAEKPGPVSAADQTAVTQGNNAFAVDLYGRLREQKGNLFFSPASISSAFAMADAGARGQTAAEMARVFHYTLPQDRLHPAMGALLAGMNAEHAGYELRVADALWAQQDSQLLPDYVSLMQADYGAGLHRVNFRTGAEAARGTINQWVEKETNDRITKLIGPGVLTPDTRMVLTNAIYFKGTWRAAFEKGATTEDGDFHVTAAQTVQSPLMHRTGGYRYYDGGTFQELELPYQGDDLAMVVVLPKHIDGLDALEQKLTAAAAEEWVEKLEPAEKVILTLPRFTMTQQFELSGTLAAMGMPQAFAASADFSGMTGKREFVIAAAIHKAFVDVNEQGTEAAAATATVMRSMAMRRPEPEPPPVVFRADHPFLFMIRDGKTGGILFLGRVEDPRK